MLFKKKLFLIIAIMYILYTVFPLFGDLLGIPVWLPSIAAFVIMSCLYPQAYSNNTFYWFAAYAAVLIFNLLLGRPLSIGVGSVADSVKIIIEFAFILPSLSIISILLYLKDERVTNKLIKWSVAILFASFIVALPLMKQYGSMREAFFEAEVEEVKVPGLPSYSLMHAFTLFLPVMCYSIKELKGKQRLFHIIGLLLLCYIIYSTSVSTSLILMLAILSFTLLYSAKNRTSSYVSVAILVIIFLLLYLSGFFLWFIDSIMPFFEGTAVEPKLVDLKDSMMGGQLTGSSITARQDHHADSWHAFLRNPIFGSYGYGSHSSILDRLGGMGLVAGIPFIMIYVSAFKRFSLLFKTRMAKVFMWLGFIMGLVFFYYKGNWGRETWLFSLVLMPIGLLSLERKILEQNQ